MNTGSRPVTLFESSTPEKFNRRGQSASIQAMTAHEAKIEVVLPHADPAAITHQRATVGGGHQYQCAGLWLVFGQGLPGKQGGQVLFQTRALTYRVHARMRGVRQAGAITAGQYLWMADALQTGIDTDEARHPWR